MIFELLMWTGAAIAGTGLIWVGSGRLESSSRRLAAYYGLPEIVQGALVAAVGSSFPELSTTVISTLVHGEFELGVAAIVGSALFNILVIPGISGLAAAEKMKTNRDLIYKEAQFYMIAVAVLTLTFAFAAIYNPVDTSASPGGIQGELTRWLALMPVGLYLLYVFLQYQDVRDADTPDVSDNLKPTREWAQLALGLILIVAGVEALIRAALAYGEILDTPTFLWGLIVVAAGTSLPDAFVSVKAARGGRSLASIANVLGSNTFDLLVCIPAGVLIAGSAVINFSLAAPLMGLLTAATILLFLLMRIDMRLSRFESSALLVTYALFVALMVVESFGWLDVIPHLPPAEAMAGNGH